SRSPRPSRAIRPPGRPAHPSGEAGDVLLADAAARAQNGAKPSRFFCVNCSSRPEAVPSHRPSEVHPMRFALILSLLVAILAVVFALYNNAPTETFIGPSYVITSPLAIVIIVTLLAGLLVGVLASVPGRVRSRNRVRKLERRIAELEAAPAAVEHRTTVVERDPRRDPLPASGAAETERLAEDTRRM